MRLKQVNIGTYSDRVGEDRYMDTRGEYVDISTLHLWDKNPKTPNNEGDERLRYQIQLGQYKPLLAMMDDGTILGGNQRYRIMQEMKFSQVWVSRISFQKKDNNRWFSSVNGQPIEAVSFKSKEDGMMAYALSDNDPVAPYDLIKLKNYTDQLALDLSKYGAITIPALSVEEVLMSINTQNTKEDEPPEVDETKTISKLGEVYQLGCHRLMCGDSTKIEDVEKLMNGQKADLLLTDPPYGVAYTGKTEKSLTMQNDEKTPKEMNAFWVQAFSNMNIVSKSGCSYYCFSSQGGEMMMMMMALFDSGFLLKQQIIWKKNTIVMGHSDYQFQHEPLFYGWKKDGTHQFYGDRTQSSVWEINKPSANKEHPTMKPIELLVIPIKNSSKSDDIILDIFLGSGSTLIACEQTSRVCYGMELDPKYCDVIRKRYAKFINKESDWERETPVV